MTDNNPSLKKKATEKAFRERIEQKIRTKLGETEGSKLSPFKVWLTCYVDSLILNSSIFKDDEYSLMKSALLTNTVPTLCSSLQYNIKKNKLRLKKVDLNEVSSIADRQPSEENENAYSKELVSIKDRNDTKNYIDSDSDNITINNRHPFLVVVPVNKIGKIIKKMHEAHCVHIGADKCYKTIKKYFIGIPRVAVREYISRCAHCQANQTVTEKQKRRQTYLNPLEEGILFERWQIDLFFMKDYNISL